jgi:hypothetical protein
MHDRKGFETYALDLSRDPGREQMTLFSLDREILDAFPRVPCCPDRTGGARIQAEGMVRMGVGEHDCARIDVGEAVAPRFSTVDHHTPSTVTNEHRCVHPMAPIHGLDLAPGAQEDELHLSAALCTLRMAFVGLCNFQW